MKINHLSLSVLLLALVLAGAALQSIFPNAPTAVGIAIGGVIGCVWLVLWPPFRAK